MSSTAKPGFSLLLSMNGSLAGPNQSIGGGDIVVFKFLRLSGTNPDLVVPTTAESYVGATGKHYRTQGNFKPTLVGILALFTIRIVQGAFHAIKNRQRYDIALSSSPFGVDLIPVWFWKARHKGAIIFHLLPPRKAVSVATYIRFRIAAIEQYLMLKVLRLACDFIVAGNEFTRKELQAHIPNAPIFILPAGFDAGRIDQAPKVAKDPNLACFVGRLVSQKGIFDLVKVMETLRNERPSLRLALAGTGPERALLEDEIRRRQLSNIELVGFVSEEQKIALLSKATFFFFPSYEEGWGIALAEALYCECRCICYELPHYRSIFADFPVYARLGDPDNFVRAILGASVVSADQKTFVRNYDDPIVVRTLVEALARMAAEPA
jgi:glycosyltransferase involved in cell wall biosynthesis